jgi:octaprenyl-diphosphate synthase
MTPNALLNSSKPASLDTLYSLVGSDLKQVDSLILFRVKNEIPLISDIVTHIVASGGKRIRPALTLICSQLCGYSGSRHITLAAAVEFIHTATLLHDDVVDESKLRRGLPTSNEVFGNKASVLVGDFVLSQAFQFMVSDGSLKVLKILSEASAIIAKGEVMQLMTEGELQTDINSYLEVITAKTAILFASACEIGAVVSGKDQQEEMLRNFGMYIGIAFQLIDDALDYASNETTLGKTVGDDFREGKVTLPVILAYKDGSAEEKAFWLRTLNELKQEADDLNQAISLLNKHQSIRQTIAMAESYCEKARQELNNFSASPARSALFDLVDFCASRAY